MSTRRELTAAEKAKVERRMGEIFGGPHGSLDAAEHARLLALAKASKLTEQDEAVFIEWAADARMTSSLVDAILGGSIRVVSVKDGDPIFELSDKGHEIAERIFGIPPTKKPEGP